VAHTDSDREWSTGYLLPALHSHGLRIISSEELGLFGEAVENALERSRYVILVITRAYLADAEARRLMTLGQHLGLERAEPNVIPLILEEDVKDELPLAIRSVVWVDATDPSRWDEAIQRIVDALKRPIQEDRPDTPAPEDLIRYEQESIGSDLWTMKDVIGYELYADAIAAGIRHPETRPPLRLA
jgi:hypothetical protein